LLVSFDIPFQERLVRLRQADSTAKLMAQSPSGLVPILRDGETIIWDSLAIAETLADRHKDKKLWRRVRRHERGLFGNHLGTSGDAKMAQRSKTRGRGRIL
jgi:glutathione S-transferase